MTNKTTWKKLKLTYRRFMAFRKLKKYHSKARSLEEIVEYAMDFGTKGPFRIRSSQKRSEILALTRAVAALNPEVILEIGTFKGGTLLIWSAIASKEVITCDLAETTLQKELYESLPPPGSNCVVTVLTGDSHEEKFKKSISDRLDGRKVDFLFIDGDHTKEGVTKDFNDYKEFVRDGGIIAFHDIVKNQPLQTNQVYYLWKDLCTNSRTEEFIDHPDQCGYGIGIIHV